MCKILGRSVKDVVDDMKEFEKYGKILKEIMSSQYVGKGFVFVRNMEAFNCPYCRKPFRLDYNNEHGFISGEKVYHKCEDCNKLISVSRESFIKLEIMKEKRGKDEQEKNN